jgi:hypothetical protein
MPVEYGVRLASRYDLFALERLMEKALAESGGLLPPHDPDHFVHSSMALISKGLVFVAVEVSEDKKRERIVGCLALDARSWHWNPRALFLESVHFYVLPEARKVKIHDGKMLLAEALLACGKQLSTVSSYHQQKDGETVFMPVPLRIDMLFQLSAEGITDNRAAAKDELMRGCGFIYVGGNHVFIPKEEQAQAAAA